MKHRDLTWLPNTPFGWSLSRVRHVCTVETGSRDTVQAVEGADYPFFVRSPQAERIDTYSYDTEAVLTAGDGDVGKVFHHFTGKFDAHQRVYVFHQFRGVDGRFFYYWLSSQFHHVTDQGTAESTVASLRRPMIVDFPVMLPPFGEQKLIAEFLDRETAQIDAMIDAQQRLVSVLSERRTATITHVVTHGLRTDVDVIATDLPWIGQTPSHWSILRLGNVGRSTIGLTYDPADITDDPEQGSLVLRAGNIQGGQISLDDSVYVTTTIPSNLRTRVGDILICARNGSAHLIGKNAVITHKVSGQTWGAFMTVYRSEANPFIRWVLNSTIFSHQMGSFSTSTVNQLTLRTLHGMRVPMPPPDEQRQIVEYLDSSAAHFDRLVSEAQRSIALLRERRAAVITAAVTGRLDPRTGVERVDEIMEGAAL